MHHTHAGIGSAENVHLGYPLAALLVAVGEGEHAGAGGGLTAGESTGVKASVCVRCEG